MAKNKRGFNSPNSMIDFNQMKLVEKTKDGYLVYDLRKKLEEWHGVEGITFNISLNEDAVPDSTEY